MKHHFRKAALIGEEKVSLTESSIQLHNSRGKLKREIEFGEIAEIHEFSGMAAVDQKHNRFEILMARIVPNRGRAITIQSSYYLGAGGRMQMAKDNSKTFNRLISTLKSRTIACNSQVDLVTGNRIASIMGYVLALSSLALLLLTLLAPIYSIFNPSRDLWGLWPVLLSSLMASIFFGLLSLKMVKSYTPQRQRLSETNCNTTQS